MATSVSRDEEGKQLGPCTVPLEYTNPHCHHTVTIRCHAFTDPNQRDRCTTLVRLPYRSCPDGHQREVPCHARDEPNIQQVACVESVQVRLPCGHSASLRCCDRNVVAPPTCNFEDVRPTLGCSFEPPHCSRQRCGSAPPLQGTDGCQVIVTWKNPKCGHDTKVMCRRRLTGPFPPCSENVRVPLPSCGHESRPLLCCSPVDPDKLPGCEQPCSKTASCGKHPCSKKCYEPCAGLGLSDMAPPDKCLRCLIDLAAVAVANAPDDAHDDGSAAPWDQPMKPIPVDAARKLQDMAAKQNLTVDLGDHRTSSSAAAGGTDAPSLGAFTEPLLQVPFARHLTAASAAGRLRNFRGFFLLPETTSCWPLQPSREGPFGEGWYFHIRPTCAPGRYFVCEAHLGVCKKRSGGVLTSGELGQLRKLQVDSMFDETLRQVWLPVSSNGSSGFRILYRIGFQSQARTTSAVLHSALSAAGGTVAPTRFAAPLLPSLGSPVAGGAAARRHGESHDVRF